MDVYLEAGSSEFTAAGSKLLSSAHLTVREFNLQQKHFVSYRCAMDNVLLQNSQTFQLISKICKS